MLARMERFVYPTIVSRKAVFALRSNGMATVSGHIRIVLQNASFSQKFRNTNGKGCSPGTDDLRLHLLTPPNQRSNQSYEFYLGDAPWQNKLSDPVTGGSLEIFNFNKVGNRRVQSVAFNATAPLGEYAYWLVNARQVGAADAWKIDVYVNEGKVASKTGTTEFGTGITSQRFLYNKSIF